MNILIKDDLQFTSYSNDYWQFCVGSCHAALAHRKDYLDQLKFVKDELGFKAVRFHGLFNDDMNVGMSMRDTVNIKSAGKFQEISFWQIADVYDNLLEIGIKPFVELGFMPAILASGKKQCRFKYKGNITMPKSLDKWGAFIEDFINFLTKRYGKDEVSSWYFEVWNEPNLPVFFAGSKEDYFKLYEATAKAVKRVNPDIRVGGPSTAASAWVEDFVAFCRRTDSPYDFVSTHQYPGDALGHNFDLSGILKGVLAGIKRLKKSKGGGVLEGVRNVFTDDTETREFVKDIFLNNAAKLKDKTDGRPLLYTEWNANATCTAECNDTEKASAYIVKTVLDLYGVIDASSFWSFSDIFEEVMFFPYEFSGSFGLLTIDGIPKPSFWAFKLLTYLGGKRTAAFICEDVEYSVFDKNGAFQILLYRQNFKSGQECEVNLSIEVSSPPQEINIYRIDRTHANAYTLWKEMGSPQYPTKEQIKYLKSESSLKAEKTAFTFDGRAVDVSLTLPSNGVVLLEFAAEKHA